jgi:hypothetical protein
MQLGTRWAFGAQPPARLPDAVVAAIRDVERAAADASTASAPSARHWMVTWLEGRPIVELDPVPGTEIVTVIRFDPARGTASIKSGDSGEESVEDEL